MAWATAKMPATSDPTAPWRRCLGAWCGVAVLTLTPSAAHAQRGPPAPAAAAAAPPIDVWLGCVREGADPGGAPCGPAQAGVEHWLAEVRRRTSVAISPSPRPLAWRDGPPNQPLVLWTGGARAPALSARERNGLRRFLQAGGTLWVDADDARSAGPFVAGVRAELVAAFGAGALTPLGKGHVLYRSFYLAAPPVGRASADVAVEGLRLGGRLAAVLLRHDLLASLTPAEESAEIVDAQADDGRRREMDLRWSVNWLMYALCGDYKDDHVHLPYILRRRG